MRAQRERAQREGAEDHKVGIGHDQELQRRYWNVYEAARPVGGDRATDGAEYDHQGNENKTVDAEPAMRRDVAAADERHLGEEERQPQCEHGAMEIEEDLLGRMYGGKERSQEERAGKAQHDHRQ